MIDGISPEQAESYESPLTSEAPFNTAVLYKRLFEEGAIRAGGYTNAGLEVDEERAKKILLDYDKNFPDPGERTRLKISIELNGQKEAENGFKRAVSIIHTSSIVDRKVMQSAARYIGLSTIKFMAGQYGSFIASTNEYQGLIKEHYPKLRYFDPRPPMPKFEKGIGKEKYFKFEVGEGSVESSVEDYMDVAELLKIKLNKDQAYDLAFVAIAAHEYAHAIIYALEDEGKSTFSKAKKLEILEERDIIRDDKLNHVHNERLARGIQQLVMKQFMVDVLRLPLDDVNEFIKILDTDNEEILEQTRDFLRRLYENGVSNGDIISAQTAVMMYVNRASGGEYELETIDGLLAYNGKAYSEDQIKEILQSLN